MHSVYTVHGTHKNEGKGLGIIGLAVHGAQRTRRKEERTAYFSFSVRCGVYIMLYNNTKKSLF